MKVGLRGPSNLYINCRNLRVREKKARPTIVSPSLTRMINKSDQSPVSAMTEDSLPQEDPSELSVITKLLVTPVSTLSSSNSSLMKSGLCKTVTLPQLAIQTKQHAKSIPTEVLHWKDFPKEF